MNIPNVSVALKLGYMHAVLTEDGDVLAECGVWHKHEDDECEVAENWTVVRVTEESEPQTTTLSCETCGSVFGSVTRLDPTHEIELLMHCPHFGGVDNSLAREAGDVHVPGGTYALIEHLTIRHGCDANQCATGHHGLEALHARYHGEHR